MADFTMIGSPEGAVCVDGVCSLPSGPDDLAPTPGIGTEEPTAARPHADPSTDDAGAGDWQD